jgi:hypothetical protein
VVPTIPNPDTIMSEITPLSQETTADGYQSTTIQVQGVPMTFTYYLGFASKVTHTPHGGSEILVYQQTETFHVPGGGGPAAACTLRIVGGPDDLDVTLAIDDSPRQGPKWEGPIQSFQVITKKSGGSGSNPRVRPVQGQNQVAAVHVQLKGDNASVRPHMPEGGGGTGVTNTPLTCPPNC